MKRVNVHGTVVTVHVVYLTTPTTTMDYELKTVLISDDVDQQCVDILSSNGIQVVKNTKLTKDQLKEEIPVVLTRKS